MLTLTLRAPRDGRFLARIVERTGSVFVLDFGDPGLIDDATQRIHRGFTVFRGGQLIKAAPRDKDLLVLLADYYAGEGLLVSLEEPLWAMRDRSLEDMLADRADEDSEAELSQSHLHFLGTVDDETTDLPTDVWGREDAEKVRALIGEGKDRQVRTTWSPPRPLDDNLQELLMDEPEDAPTVEVPRPERLPDSVPTLSDDDETEVVPREALEAIEKSTNEDDR